MPPSMNQLSARPATVGVALIDGVPLVREGLSALVHRTPGLRWIGAAENPSVGVRLCERLRPDVVVVDAALDPRGQLSHLLASNPGLSVVLMVDDPHLTTQYVSAAVTHGVHGVIRRTAQPPQLVKAIQAVHTDGRYVDAALSASLSSAGRSRRPNSPHQPLSQREHEVLRLIADGLENQAIANILFVSVETIRTHVKSILRKLATRDRTHAVAVAFRSGVLVVEPSPVPGTRTARD
jgi:DNA-binding NarL/FixJ family response regulator